MSLPHFFIHRPVFAWVLAIVTMLAGVFALSGLPIAQYPEVAPTSVRISATYSGASAETVENAVTIPIEDGLTGLDGLLYMTSTSSEGSASIQLTFDESIDPDIAQVQVQNKLQLVESSLPSSVQQRGVSVTRSTSSILLVGALVSTDDRYSSVELGDMLDRLLIDPIKRVDGVGSINVLGTEYAMRIWLDPDRLFQYQLTATDVTDAVSAQNTNVTVGALGDQPTTRGQQVTFSLTAQSQLSTVQEFERILLVANEDGSSVFLGDVARVEIAAESYGSFARFSGHPAAGFGVNLATGANAVDTADAVRAEAEKLTATLPEGVELVYPYDTSPFVEQSIEQVYHTLAEAIVLVFLVIFVFLQSWRATLIPTIAVPIVLLGTFGVLAALDMSINTLTMFALVLAIGLLVDDAIVVVENVERVMEEEGLGPVEATEKSMGEISSALVGIVLVLSAVFLPMAFMSGSTGVIYRQFSVTIISAMFLSLLVALILTPAMCASLLRPGHGPARFAPARWFNAGLGRLTGGYAGGVARFSTRPFRMLLVLGLVGAGAAALYRDLPTSFLPQEDQGVLMVQFSLPEGAVTAQTEEAARRVETYMLTEEADAVDSAFTALGFGFSGSGQNAAMMFVKLKDYAERPGIDAASVALRANMRFANDRAGQIIVIQPPAIQGLGNTAGFSMQFVDQGGQGTAAMNAAAAELLAQAAADGRAASLRGAENLTKTALRLDIDQQKAESLGVSLSSVNDILSTVFAGSYVNDFTLGARLREVIVQGDAEWRMQPEDLGRWYARNDAGEMAPFAAFSSQEWEQVSPRLQRYGGQRSLEISGASGPGISSGDAMDAMEELTAALPGGYGAEWTGISYQERLSGNQEPLLYTLSAIVVFLCLAALYESWTAPLAVMLAVPVGVLGALATALHFGQSNDVYFKVGLLTTIGLAARNAILIVEFAKALQAQGMELVEATVSAARQRLRPILMTSLAFMLGILPLAIASGAGAAAQRSIGIGMLGGIIASTLVGVVMAPVLYVAVMRAATIFHRRESRT
ncbi:multidrug efflux pump [Albimonas donghaensis]|uniref:Efflux pump membrane transporter n=1 Tax=Albimonas donghaensis TaxID=356660 RepID=A0A1H3BX47_9RHOB|nr:multidrug efflux pump [Albimonas donghaensis]